jgi:hypothetical protein
MRAVIQLAGHARGGCSSERSDLLLDCSRLLLISRVLSLTRSPNPTPSLRSRKLGRFRHSKRLEVVLDGIRKISGERLGRDHEPSRGVLSSQSALEMMRVLVFHMAFI